MGRVLGFRVVGFQDIRLGVGFMLRVQGPFEEALWMVFRAKGFRVSGFCVPPKPQTPNP